MLEVKREASPQEASLDDCGGGAVMLSLDNGDGRVFRQALDARDAGKVLGVLNRYSDEEVVWSSSLTD